MKSYPKVPQYYHSATPSSLFNKDDLFTLEKTDGQNFRIVLYDETLHEYYTDEIHKYDPRHKDVFIGTKSHIRGKLSDPVSSFDFDFDRVIPELREQLDIDKLLKIQHFYEKPLVLFGEHMVPHSLDYNYTGDPPPAFIGFDIYPQSKNEPDPPSNPLEEDFEGFLNYAEVEQIFGKIGLVAAPVVESTLPSPVDPETYTIPESNFADITAEGVIFRSDSSVHRAKKTTDEFEERNKELWGLREDQAETGAELLLAKYITKTRVKKQLYPLLLQGEKINMNKVAWNTIEDMWIEEWEDFSQINESVDFTEFISKVEKQCETVLDNIQKTAILTDKQPEDVYDFKILEDLPKTAENMNIFEDYKSKEECEQVLARVNNTFESTSSVNSFEESLVDTILTQEQILSVARSVGETTTVENRDIPETIDKCMELLFLHHAYVFLLSEHEIQLNKVKSIINTKVPNTVTSR